MNYAIQSPSQLAVHLRALRKARGLSQTDLGARLGLSQSRLARMENAPTQISVGALLELLSALGAHVELVDGQADAATVAKASKPFQGDW